MNKRAIRVNMRYVSNIKGGKHGFPATFIGLFCPDSEKNEMSTYFRPHEISPHVLKILDFGLYAARTTWMEDLPPPK